MYLERGSQSKTWAAMRCSLLRLSPGDGRSFQQGSGSVRRKTLSAPGRIALTGETCLSSFSWPSSSPRKSWKKLQQVFHLLGLQLHSAEALTLGSCLDCIEATLQPCLCLGLYPVELDSDPDPWADILASLLNSNCLYCTLTER